MRKIFCQARKYLAMVAMALCSAVAAQAQPTFATGADLSWITEMEDNGYSFTVSNTTSTSSDLFQILADEGMNSVRIRVWVNPEDIYGSKYSNLTDVLAKCKRANAAGLHIMLDFHYSDVFADPEAQIIPIAWGQNSSLSVLADSITAHTKHVLTAVKEAGYTPTWIQVGNEIDAGICWGSTKDAYSATYPANSYCVWGTNNGTKSNNWSSLATLYKAGYQACKSVFSDVPVVLHLSNNAATDKDNWYSTWLSSFVSACSNTQYFDIIGLSVYPTFSSTSDTSYKTTNATAVSYLSGWCKTYSCTGLIVETGTYMYYDSEGAAMTDLFEEVAENGSTYIKGIFYWEPEVSSDWKPSYYSTVNWKAYEQGAATISNKVSTLSSTVLAKFFTAGSDDDSSDSDDYTTSSSLYFWGNDAVWDASKAGAGTLSETSDGVYEGTLVLTADKNDSSVGYFYFVTTEFAGVWDTIANNCLGAASNGTQLTLGMAATMTTNTYSWKYSPGTYYVVVNTTESTVTLYDYVPVTISSAGYATLYHEGDLTVPSGVTAYAAEVNSAQTEATLTTVGETIYSETPVVLKGSAGTYQFPITAASGNAYSGTNSLKGTLTNDKIDEDDVTYYILGDKNGIGFYYLTGTAGAYVSDIAYKAYLPLTSSSNVRGVPLVFGDDEEDTSAISTLASDEETLAAPTGIYTLMGSKLNSLDGAPAGLYIINGKKILVK